MGAEGETEDDGGLELDAPEGIDPNDPVFSDFKKVAGELGLDAAQAGKVLELHERALDAQREAWDAQVEGWEQSAREDSEIGGRAFDSSLGLAIGVVKEFGTPALAEALNAHGYGNHPSWSGFSRASGRRSTTRGGSGQRRGERGRLRGLLGSPHVTYARNGPKPPPFCGRCGRRLDFTVVADPP